MRPTAVYAHLARGLVGEVVRERVPIVPDFEWDELGPVYVVRFQTESRVANGEVTALAYGDELEVVE